MNTFEILDRKAAALNILIEEAELLLEDLNERYQTTGERYLEEKAKVYKELAQHSALLIEVERELEKFLPKEPCDELGWVGAPQPTQDPEILNLSNQAHDIRNYMNEMEIMGDLWSQKDLEYYMYIESLLIEIEEELHYLQVNEIF